MGRNKQLRKRIAGLERAREEHVRKIEEYEGNNEHLIQYWEGEVESFDEKRADTKRKMKRK